MNWKFWRKAEKLGLRGVNEWVLELNERVQDIEGRLKVTEAMAMRTQTKVYRDINAGVVYPQEHNKVEQPLTNYGPGDIIPENTQWG